MHLDIVLDDGDAVVYVSSGITLHFREQPGVEDFKSIKLSSAQVDAIRQQLGYWCERPLPHGLVSAAGVNWAM